ncbi:hypothetical protein OH799_19335 [Nocardia sp. NBC_00881]|uniref:hypothetical protein n=1 Tax=Nocardia sp. NBC_00881 TaxID=2975995 RepID=UPI00386BB4FD|nr:hypothetical protein OH799_19335 [Nocardia sp. NBC_00881]
MVHHTLRLPRITVPHSTDLAVFTVNAVAAGGSWILRATRRARLLGVLALLIGIVAMHSAVFGISGHAHATADRAAMAVPNDNTSPMPPFAVVSSDAPGRATAAIFGAASSAEPDQREPEPSRDRTQRGRDTAQPGGNSEFSGSVVRKDHIHKAQGDREINQATRPSGTPGRPPAPTTLPVDAAALDTVSVAADLGCAGDQCGGAHGGMHGCVFILATVTVLFALVLLYRMAVDRPGSGVALPRHWRPRRSRPPPWTVPTLAELAILRI